MLERSIGVVVGAGGLVVSIDRALADTLAPAGWQGRLQCSRGLCAMGAPADFAAKFDRR